VDGQPRSLDAARTHPFALSDRWDRAIDRLRAGGGQLANSITREASTVEVELSLAGGQRQQEHLGEVGKPWPATASERILLDALTPAAAEAGLSVVGRPPHLRCAVHDEVVVTTVALELLCGRP
jgi:hypothetical protein